MLHNFSLFLPLPATLGIPLPAPSFPASRTPPAPFSSGLPVSRPPAPPPPPVTIVLTSSEEMKATSSNQLSTPKWWVVMVKFRDKISWPKISWQSFVTNLCGKFRDKISASIRPTLVWTVIFTRISYIQIFNKQRSCSRCVVLTRTIT